MADGKDATMRKRTVKHSPVATDKKNNATDDVTESKNEEDDVFHRIFGFGIEDLRSTTAFVKLMCRPTDPAGLGVMRIMFGVLMMLDIFQERGLGRLAEEYSDPDLCRFPLFTFLRPLPLEWMYIVYLAMFIGELGILLGVLYRSCCLLFVVCYWYLLLLEKSYWNNHSYLYGLFGVMLLITDANRYWSLDGLIFRRKRHAHVPLWNYALLRFQIFLVYFVAGLKKLDPDWTFGHSMHPIAGHVVFAPFRLLLTEEQVSLYVVHLGGLVIDISIGFLLFFDKTRFIAFVFGSSFHLMNSQLFSIGMFPWTMLATLPLFCHVDWPRHWCRRCPSRLYGVLPADVPLQPSTHCLYSKEDIKPDRKYTTVSGNHCDAPQTRPTLRHHLMTSVVLVYVATQCVLPYSHGITKGYNSWTSGLYGYSWDMMVHRWQLQHVKVTYVDKVTREQGYLNPTVWTHSGRWSSRPDMTKQYAACVQARLARYNISDIELYVDVWWALNDRFQQRTFDPRVDMLAAPWSPFTTTPWVLPLLVDLSDWRGKLAEIQTALRDSASDADVVFVSDFPGLHLENYVHEDLGNTSVTVLKGEITVELVDRGHNSTLKEGDRMQLPSGEFHNIHTVSTEPSCYMYIFVNTTDVELQRVVRLYEQVLNGTFTGTDEEGRAVRSEVEDGSRRHQYIQYMYNMRVADHSDQQSLVQQLAGWWDMKQLLLTQSIQFTAGAVVSILTGSSFHDFLNATFAEEISQNAGSATSGNPHTTESSLEAA